MTYIRTNKGFYRVEKEDFNYVGKQYKKATWNESELVVAQANNINELIQKGDIVFYWNQSDDTERCFCIVYDSDKDNCGLVGLPITKLLIPVGENYKCVAKGHPSFELIRERKYLVNKGELELL